MNSSEIPLQADKVQLRVFEDGYRVCLGVGSYMRPHDLASAMRMAVAYARRHGIPQVEICDANGVVERTVAVPPSVE